MIRRIRRHLAKLDLRHRQIALGFLWVGLFVFVGKLAGAAKEMAIAWRYGVSATVDAYVFVLNLIIWPVSVWFSILTVVLLPLVARLRGYADGELPRFYAEVMGLTVAIGIALGFFYWLAFPVLLRSGWLGISANSLEAALEMAGGLAILGPLGAVISLFSAWLLAEGKHRNTLFEAIPALTLLAILLVLPNSIPEPLVWGTVAGYSLQAAALGVSIHRRGGLPSPSFAQRSPAWQYFWSSIGIMSLGQTLSSLTTLIDQFFVVGLGDGAISSLNYANRILMLLMGLGATAISRATLPVFSTNSDVNVAGLALRWTMLMFIFGVAVLLVSWPLAPWAVGLLFERGAFNSENTNSVAGILRFSLLQVVFYFPALVLVSVLVAQRRYSLFAASGAVNLVSKVAFAFFLVPHLGIQGVVLSTVLMYGVSAALLVWFVYGVEMRNR